MDYSSYLQNPTKRSPRNDVAYPYMYPLTASSLDDRLNFPFTPTSYWFDSVIPQVGNVLPNSHFPHFTADPSNPKSQLRMTSTDPLEPLNAVDYFIMDNPDPSSSNGWTVRTSVSMDKGGLYWNLMEGVNPGTAGQNIALNPVNYGSQYKPKIMCFDPSSTDPYDANIRFQPPTQGNQAACKWRTDLEVFGCCTATPSQSTNPDIIQRCAPAFMPNGAGGSLCVPFILNICENKWDQDYCKSYLQSFQNGVGNSDVLTVFQNASVNYINNMAASTGCGTNDYTSVKLGNSCTMPNGKQRDDSTDTFINGTMAYFCNQNPGKFDIILNQYCAQFTRKDLDKDPSLQVLCGCHLTSTEQNPPIPSNLELNLKNPPQTDNQYVYPGITIACDPICAYSGTIPSAPSAASPCSSTVCIMDNTSISTINSNCDASITQICGASFGGQTGTGNCYMSNVDIDLINSTCAYAKIAQYCGACYSYEEGNPAAAVKVQCPTPGTNPTPGGGGNGGGSKSSNTWSFSGFLKWVKSHPGFLVGVSILFSVLIFFILYFSLPTESEDSGK